MSIDFVAAFETAHDAVDRTEEIIFDLFLVIARSINAASLQTLAISAPKARGLLGQELAVKVRIELYLYVENFSVLQVRRAIRH